MELDGPDHFIIELKDGKLRHKLAPFSKHREEMIRKMNYKLFSLHYFHEIIHKNQELFEVGHRTLLKS